MHLATDTVSGQFTDNAVAMSLAVFLDGTTDVTEMVTGNSLCNTEVK